MGDTKLCEICNQLSVEQLVKLFVDSDAKRTRPYYRLPDGAWLPHHSSYDNLIASAQGGCGLCNEIWTACRLPRHHYRQGDGDRVRDYDSVEKVLGTLNPEEISSSTGLEICITSSRITAMGDKRRMDTLIIRIGRFDLVVEFKLSRSRVDQIIECEDFTIGRYEISPDLGSDDNFNVAKSWLSACQSEHGKTCFPIQPTALPDRVLDVGGSKKPGSLRVLETGGIQGVYLTLSHCWGDPTHVLQTTSKNLQKMKMGVEFSEMPKSFQDSVIIARKLGYQYVWIDSLCILQDSRQDWETAAAKMGDIYKNSALTIAAAFSTDSSGGLLHVFEPAPTIILHNSLRIANRDTYKPISISRKDKYEEQILDGVAKSHLATRGWALQEQYLSERVLYYGERQIYWECRGLHCAADGEESDVFNEDQFRRWDHTHQDDCNQNPPEILHAQYREMYTTWYAILERYSKRNLTIEGDKFLALSGIAAQFAHLTGDKYIAGIWERDLKVGLLWRCEDSQNARRPFAFRAPSWSWASLDAHILIDTDHNDSANTLHDVEIISWDIELGGKDHFGCVQAARLTLSGYSWPLLKINEDISKEKFQHDRYFGHPVFDVASDGNGADMPDAYFDAANQRFVCGWKQQTHGETPQIKAESLILLLVRMIREVSFPARATSGFEETSFKRYSQYGALILRTVSEEKALYERVGYLSMYCTLSLYSTAWSKSVITII